MNEKHIYPSIPNAFSIIYDMCYWSANKIYGKKLPLEVSERLEKELSSIKENDFASLYLIANNISRFNGENGKHFGLRGSSGASFVSYLLGISETNPLPAHYICPKCHYIDFPEEELNRIGLDLKDQECPICGEMLKKDGFNLSYEIFAGLHADKEPNFGFYVDYYFKDNVIEYKKNMAELIAFDLSETFPQMEVITDKSITALNKLSETTGLKVKDIPFNDKKVKGLFSSCKNLGIDPEQIGGIEVGTLGIPEFSDLLSNDIIQKIRPKSFEDIIRVIGFAYGDGTWKDNAEELVEKGINPRECISLRDDISSFLQEKGMPHEEAFKIMEFVRKGKAFSSAVYSNWEGEMFEFKQGLKKYCVPEWYEESCEKIKYLLPKTQAVVYALNAWRLLYYKLYYPEQFYDAWMNILSSGFRYLNLYKGYDYALRKYSSLKKMNERKGLSEKAEMVYNELPIVLEMYARNIIR